MPTNKETAAIRREIADLYDSIGRPGYAKNERSLADALDPPKPQYADGTIAWVTSGETYKQTHLCERKDGSWVSTLGQDGKVFAFVDEKYVQHVEPLRVLADDEIAVKRVWTTCSANSWRDEARNALSEDCPASAAATLCNAYADALEAEEATR